MVLALVTPLLGKLSDTTLFKHNMGIVTFAKILSIGLFTRITNPNSAFSIFIIVLVLFGGVA